MLGKLKVHKETYQDWSVIDVTSTIMYNVRAYVIVGTHVEVTTWAIESQFKRKTDYTNPKQDKTRNRKINQITHNILVETISKRIGQNKQKLKFYPSW